MALDAKHNKEGDIMLVTVEQDEKYAPNSYILRSVDTQETVLIQADWEFPALASLFGYHRSCAFRTNSTAEIAKARDMIDENLDVVVDSIFAEEWFYSE